MLRNDFDPGPVRETGSLGVVLDVLGDFAKRGFIANKMVDPPAVYLYLLFSPHGPVYEAAIAQYTLVR